MEDLSTFFTRLQNPIILKIEVGTLTTESISNPDSILSLTLLPEKGYIVKYGIEPEGILPPNEAAKLVLTLRQQIKDMPGSIIIHDDPYKLLNPVSSFVRRFFQL